MCALPAHAAEHALGAGGPEWLSWVNIYLAHGTPLFMALYAALIIFFAFFYSGIVFNPDDTAENLKKHGGFVPGIRPGKNTAEYLRHIIFRLGTIGALYLTLVALLPEILRAQYSALPFYFGGTSLLIVVTVTMDTVGQIHAHLLAHQYEGLIKKSKLKGRRG